MNDHTKATIKNAAMLGARVLRHYRRARPYEALSTLKQALAISAEALDLLEYELEQANEESFRPLPFAPEDEEFM